MSAEKAESIENQGIPGTVVKFKEGSSKFKESPLSALEWSFKRHSVKSGAQNRDSSAAEE